MMLKYINKLVSLLRRLLKRKSNKGNIAVLSFKFLGDTVFTIPAVELIQKSYPDYKLTIFCYPESKAIYELYFTNINYECYEKKDWDLENRNINLKILNAVKRIRSLKLELIFDFTSNYKSAIICLFSGAVCLGFGNKLLTNFFDYFNPKKDNFHLMDMFIFPLRQLIPENVLPEKEYKVNPVEVKKILINPFAGWKAKEWNWEKYLQLAEQLKKDYQVEFILKKNLMDDEKLKQIRSLKIKITLSERIEELIDAIKNHDLILSNDTGIIQIASILGKPTFTIYGPTNPLFHKPYGAFHRYIQKKIICSPGIEDKMCFTFGGRIGCPSFECMNLLTLEEVLAELSGFIQEINHMD